MSSTFPNPWPSRCRRASFFVILAGLPMSSCLHAQTGDGNGADRQASEAAAEMRSIEDGVYTASQAARGAKTFDDVCYACHDVDEFQEKAFLSEWEGRPLGDLFDQIRSTMPEDGPGTLGRRSYAAIMAYLLEINGLPAGEEDLPRQDEPLSKIVIKWAGNG